MSEISVARKEIKYLLDPKTACRIQQDLQALLPLDRPDTPDGYLVRSLYFDTVYEKDYYDKLDGLEMRRKIRLRIYSPGDTTAKLEVKEKQGSDQWKRSAVISKEDTRLLIAGNYRALRHKSLPPFCRSVLLMMETQAYRPKTIVEFRRLAFLGRINNTRITFDSRLKATEVSFDLFSPALSLYPIPHPIILEVKYNHFLQGYIKQLLNFADQIPAATSKYALGRQIGFY